jgi:hypothetical protein
LKRIAIQYSGEIRNLLDCFNNHYENFVLKNPDYQVDIFAHLWASPDDNRMSRISSLLNAKRISFEPQIQFNRHDIIQDPRFPWYTPNMVSMFYGIEKVNEIRNVYENINNIKYDYVIRMRPDIIFLPDYVKPIDYYEKDFLHLKDFNPYESQGLPYAINDYFAIGSPELIDLYSKVYSNLDRMILEGAAINPELLLGYNIKDLPNKRHDLRMWPYKYILMYLADHRNGNVG